ncbi:MAG: rod shape-determining protein MreD [Candidatus Latescibacteria bacterium]|nr:rod shape-determining protein MreD [Candidatus Latescibacterota bacterium]
MRILRYSLLLILALILQTTWVPAVAVFGIQPELVLLALVMIGLAAGPFEATLFGFGIGLIQDAYMPDNFGLNALVNSIIGFTVGWGRVRIVAESFYVQVVLVVGATLVQGLLVLIGDSQKGWGEIPFFWVRYILWNALYNGAVMALLGGFLLLRRRLFAPQAHEY